jgi:hypothetical protein
MFLKNKYAQSFSRFTLSADGPIGEMLGLSSLTFRPLFGVMPRHRSPENSRAVQSQVFGSGSSTSAGDGNSSR